MALINNHGKVRQGCYRYPESAHSFVENGGVDLLVVDTAMPEVDGYQVCQYVKGQEELKDIPVIMTTMETGIEGLQKAFDMGAMDYISKPIREIELLTRVRSALLLKKEIDMRKDREIELLAVKRKLEEANGKLQQISITDTVTGLANQRHFDSTLRIEIRRAMRGNYFLSLIRASMDYCKRYNDIYGRRAGDSVLSEVAKMFKNSFKRAGDFVAYYGYGDFYIILPMTDSKGALYVARSMQSSVESLQISHEGNSASKFVTLSFGVATALGEPGLTSSRLIAMADEALHIAKRAGRNQVAKYQN
jgi:diguanylate cyclase (GGDEF) domain